MDAKKDPLTIDVKDEHADAPVSVQVFRDPSATAFYNLSSTSGYPGNAKLMRFPISAIVFSRMNRIINLYGLTHDEFHDKCEVSLETIAQLHQCLMPI